MNQSLHRGLARTRRLHCVACASTFTRETTVILADSLSISSGICIRIRIAFGPLNNHALPHPVALCHAVYILQCLAESGRECPGNTVDVDSQTHMIGPVTLLTTYLFVHVRRSFCFTVGAPLTSVGQTASIISQNKHSSETHSSADRKSFRTT